MYVLQAPSLDPAAGHTPACCCQVDIGVPKQDLAGDNVAESAAQGNLKMWLLNSRQRRAVAYNMCTNRVATLILFLACTAALAWGLQKLLW